MAEGLRRARFPAVSLALALSIGVAGALAGVRYPDPAGDVNGGAGPDLTSVSVSHTATTVAFRLVFAKAPPLGASASEHWVDMLVVGIDVPPRGLKRTARGWAGLDYYVGLHGTDKTALLVRSGPAGSMPRVVSRVRVSVRGRTLSFSVSRRNLGKPAWFDFAVAAGRELSNESAAGGGSDEAPARGAFHYTLTG